MRWHGTVDLSAWPGGVAMFWRCGCVIRLSLLFGLGPPCLLRALLIAKCEAKWPESQEYPESSRYLGNTHNAYTRPCPLLICDFTHPMTLFNVQFTEFSFNHCGECSRLWIKRKCICILNIIHLILILKL